MSTPPEPSPPTPPPPSDAILAIPATVSVAVAVADAQPQLNPPPRKFPAPCWTHDETLALIQSYQDKWYSLRRRNLRTADWEAVAEEVTRRCPNQSPAKTSAQCRHKMEKLRKRYRAEKQRINSLPQTHGNNRFFGSSWVFFDLIDSMELGSGGGPPQINNNNNIVHNNMNPQFSNVGRVDLDVKPFSMNHMNNMNVIANEKGADFDRVNPNHVNVNGSNKKVDLGKYYDEIMLGNNNNNNKGKSQNHEFDARSAAPHIKFKVKNHHHPNSRVEYGGGGDLNDDFDEDDEYDVSGGGSGGGLMSAQGGIKRKSGGYEKYDDDEVYLSRKDPVGGSRGKESVVGEMVASIKMLGEGMVKMEKMKMEMMRDMEKMRMEMEMKRSEMILESQHLIVNAFVEGLKKYKKVKVMEIE